MTRNDSNAELESLLREILLDGAPRRGELNSLLRDRPEARPILARLLVEEAALISALRLESVERWADSLPPRTIRLAEAKPQKAPWIRWLPAAAAIAACVLAMWLLRGMHPTPPATITGSPKPDDWIGWMQRTGGPTAESPPVSVLEGDTIELKDERARLDLGNGVVISVTGPARLKVSLMDCRLWSGQVTVDVPKHLKTFVVRTDNGRFVDLGTTFSVAAQPGRGSEMGVLIGMVRAERLSYEGDVLNEQLVRKEEGVVLDGQAADIKTVPAGTLGHLAPIPPDDTPLIVPAAYAEAVNASRPLLHWDFETRTRQGRFANRAGPGFEGVVHGRIRSGGAGRGDIVLGEQENATGWIESSEPWIKSDPEPFTIELWARPDRIHWGLLANLRTETPMDPVTGHAPIGPLSYFSMEVTHNRIFPTMPIEPSIRCTFRSPATEHPQGTVMGGVNAALASPSRYVPGKWHHLVARMDHEFTLFIDGEVAVKQSLTRPDMGAQMLHFLVGSMHYPQGNRRQFVGAMDEFAVYPHALSENEVKAHFLAMTGRSAD